MYCQNGLAYLCGSLDIIIADLSKYEIKDTWIIRKNRGQVSIYWLYQYGSFIMGHR